MSNEIKRATGLLVIEVVNSNPNGDPDRESDPRQRPNGCGEISPVSFKRKLRELLDDHDAPFFKILPELFVQNEGRYQILEHRGRDRKAITEEMGKDPTKYMESEFVRKYWDARIFGNTFLENNGEKALSKPASCSLEWAYPLLRLISSARQTRTRQASKKGRMRVWRRWLTAL